MAPLMQDGNLIVSHPMFILSTIQKIPSQPFSELESAFFPIRAQAYAYPELDNDQDK